jgi:hypothetical protein
LIRQKSKFLRHDATAPTIRRLSEKKWPMALNTAKEQAQVVQKCFDQAADKLEANGDVYEST